jgi:hypothetical protein
VKPVVAGTPDRRLERWLNLAPKASRDLAAAVRAEVVVPLSAQGFSWVARHHYDPDPEPNSAREILLERRDADDVETVVLSFDKYRRPRLQVWLMRRSAEPPHNWVRAANLVRQHGQPFYFWGKPWWMPSALWPRTAGLRTAEAIRLRLPAALAFLRQGKDDRCIAAFDLQMLANHHRLVARAL